VWKTGKYFETGILENVFSKYLELKQKYLNTKIQKNSFEVFQIQNIKYKKYFKHLFEI